MTTNSRTVVVFEPIANGDVPVFNAVNDRFEPSPFVSGLPTVIIPLFAGALFTTTSDAFVRATSYNLDLAGWPATIGTLTRSIAFKANIEGSGCGGALVHVRLQNITDAETVTGTALSAPGENTGETSEVSSGPLTVGVAAGNLRDGRLYEVQIHDTLGVSLDASIANARLEVSYA